MRDVEVLEEGAEEKVWTQEGRNNKRLEIKSA
jgi:hypothetical protein